MLNVPSHSQRLPSTKTEIRGEPRYSYQLIFSAAGLEIPSANISFHGAQLCCPCMRYKTFQAACQDPQLRLSWNIPGDQSAILANTVLRYANLCDDEYLVGLEFTEFAGDSEQRWRSFIVALEAKRFTD